MDSPDGRNVERKDERKDERNDERKDRRNTVRVTIYNQPYTLAVSGESTDVETLAHSVDQLMSDIAHQAGNVDGSSIAVLACLHLADRLRGVEQELSDFRHHIGEKSRQFSTLLDQASR
jgi:cell division protein ZapA